MHYESLLVLFTSDSDLSLYTECILIHYFRFQHFQHILFKILPVNRSSVFLLTNGKVASAQTQAGHVTLEQARSKSAVGPSAATSLKQAGRKWASPAPREC